MLPPARAFDAGSHAEALIAAEFEPAHRHAMPAREPGMAAHEPATAMTPAAGALGTLGARAFLRPGPCGTRGPLVGLLGPGCERSGAHHTERNECDLHDSAKHLNLQVGTRSGGLTGSDAIRVLLLRV